MNECGCNKCRYCQGYTIAYIACLNFVKSIEMEYERTGSLMRLGTVSEQLESTLGWFCKVQEATVKELK